MIQKPSQENRSTELAPKKPLVADLPHIAYILLWYPLFTQPFIFREIAGLRAILPIEIFTLYGRNLRHCSDEMLKEAHRGHAHGLRSVPRVCFELLCEMLRHPRRLARLFKRSCLRRWSSFETFGENLWAFCVGVHLGRQLCERGIDLVYAPWPRGAATAAWVAASIADLPFATSARGDNLAPADPDLADKLSAALFVRANNAADQGRIEEFDKGQAKGKTVLVYNSLTLPIPDEYPAQRFQNQVLRLLALGRFDVTKGFDVLLRACALLKKRGVNFHLTLAGSGGRVMGLGKQDGFLHDLCKELNLGNEVTMPGLLSHNELPELFRTHDIFAAPCVIHPSGRRDGIPNTVIEAMTYAMPVVSTTVNALPEIIRNGKTGLAVEPDDPQALADAIALLAQNPEKASALGKQGAELVREMFDPSANSARLSEIFKSCFESWCKSKAERRIGSDSQCAV